MGSCSGWREERKITASQIIPRPSKIAARNAKRSISAILSKEKFMITVTWSVEVAFVRVMLPNEEEEEEEEYFIYPRLSHQAYL